jgi:hypothetical protein
MSDLSLIAVWPFARLLGASLAVCLLAPAMAANRTPAPAAVCLDARQVERAVPVAADALVVSQRDGRRFHLATSGACPGMNDPGAELRVLAHDGWACGHGGDFVLVAGQDSLCPVAGLTELDESGFAHLLEAADTTKSMAPVEVRAKSSWRTRFRSPEYCFPSRAVRSWTEDAGGLLVSVDPRRSGGYGRYRVKLVGRCPGLVNKPRAVFQSALGNGLICGIAGEKVVLLNEDLPTMVRASGPAFATSLAHLDACVVSEVHPLAD